MLNAALTGMASALQHLQPHIETQNPFQAIFIAPEYLFVGRRSTQRRAAMRTSSKDKLLASLQSISKAFPKILIIAGTAFWREDLDTDETQDKYKANLLAAYMKATNFGRAKHPDAFVLDGWTQRSTGKRIPGLDELVGKVPKYRAYNTIFAFLNGQRAFAPYTKECDFLETDGASLEKIAYVPGLSGGMREVGNFKFGLEVCFDHANNTLKGKKADFHVVVSDSADTRPNQNIGGFLLHASSDCRETGVWQSGSTQRLATIDNAVPGDYDVNSWLCPIDARP
jgi:hypothetical protein